MNLSRHAQRRLAQRNIPEIWIQLLKLAGERKRQDGAIIHYLTRRRAKRLRSQLRDIIDRMDALAHTYAVESSSDPTLITAGYHYRRLHHR